MKNEIVYLSVGINNDGGTAYASLWIHRGDGGKCHNYMAEIGSKRANLFFSILNSYYAKVEDTNV